MHSVYCKQPALQFSSSLMTTWLIAGKLVETVNQKSGQAFRSLSSFCFSALWPATDTKGLFTWRWGTPDRWGNREFKQQRRRRLRKRHSKSEVAPLLTLSRLFQNVKTKRENRHFHIVVVQWRQRNVQKSVIHVQSCCLLIWTNCFFAVLVDVAVVVA